MDERVYTQMMDCFLKAGETFCILGNTSLG